MNWAFPISFVQFFIIVSRSHMSAFFIFSVAALPNAHPSPLQTKDPEALSANHDRRIYDDLSSAWREMQAESPSMTSEPGHFGTQYA